MAGTSKPYLISVSLLAAVLPIAATIAEALTTQQPMWSLALFGKWFIFSAVGLRLALAGAKQISDPAFTAKQIFQLDSPDSLPIVRELGFANMCFGLIGIASLFLPSWRIVSAFGSGLYYGLAGALHLIKKPVGPNEQFALVTDMLIFTVLLAYFVVMF